MIYRTVAVATKVRVTAHNGARTDSATHYMPDSTGYAAMGRLALAQAPVSFIPLADREVLWPDLYGPQTSGFFARTTPMTLTLSEVSALIHAGVQK